MVHIAIVGDVHRRFSKADVTYFNNSSYDLILFVGDLANWWPHEGLQIARAIAHLKKPALFLPGNHDAVTAFQLLAELKHLPPLIRLFGLGQDRRQRALQRSLADVTMCGYSTHSFAIRGHCFDVVAARPYSMGGPHLGLQPHLKRQFGVDSMAASETKLRQCVDEAASDHLLFLAHNGPTGLGASRADIWGNDFSPAEGDFGDQDLQLAVAYAQDSGKRIIGVIGGHMHHELTGGGKRRWQIVSQGVHYINAARVPRIFVQNGQTVHHHVSLSFDGDNIAIDERLARIG